MNTILIFWLNEHRKLTLSTLFEVIWLVCRMWLVTYTNKRIEVTEFSYYYRQECRYSWSSSATRTFLACKETDKKRLVKISIELFPLTTTVATTIMVVIILNTSVLGPPLNRALCSWSHSNVCLRILVKIIDH